MANAIYIMFGVKKSVWKFSLLALILPYKFFQKIMI